jgi:Dolichyl-phosphate-mannose-protein mannosyltransferase
LAGFALLTALMFWPIVAHLSSRILFTGGDGASVMWSWWHIGRQLAHFRDPFSTSGMFFPVGTNLAFHTTSPLVAVLLWPVTRVFGVGVTVNVVELGSAFLSAVFAYLLALRVCGDRRAAFVAGVAFAFMPYRFVHAPEHYTLIQVEFLPMGALALLRICDRPTKWRGVALGATIGMAYLTDLYVFTFLVLVVAVLALAKRTSLACRHALAALAAAALTAGMLAAPLAAAQLLAVGHGDLQSLPGWGGANIYSADAVAWFLPRPEQPVLGRALDPLMSGGGEAYVGLTVLCLAVAGAWLGDRERRKGWVALAVVSGVLAMGPFLRVANRVGALFTLRSTHFSLPLPYMAVAYVPILSGIRAPIRLVVVTDLALGVLMSVTLSGLMRRWPKRAWSIATLSCAAVVLEFLPGQVPTLPTAVPRPYSAIAARHDALAVLDLPLQWFGASRVVGDTQRYDSILLYYATVHEHAVVNGSVARYSDSRLARLEAIPVYRQVASLAGDPGFADRATFDAADLRSVGIGYIVYHRDRPQPRLYAYVESLRLPILADDGEVLVWRVPV